MGNGFPLFGRNGFPLWDAVDGTMRHAIGECPCYVQLRKCSDGSLSGLWVDRDDVPEGMTVLLTGDVCYTPTGPTSYCPQTTASGTWYANCAACEEVTPPCPPCDDTVLPTEVDLATAGGPWQCTSELGTPATITMASSVVVNERFYGTEFPMGASIYCGFPEWLTPGEPGYAEAAAIADPATMPWVLVVEEGTSISACGEYVHIFVLPCVAAVTGAYQHAYSYSFPGYPTFTNSGSVVVS